MIFSQQGFPSLDFTLDKTYFYKGDKIGGFTVPFNIEGDTKSIFYRFKLWNNTNGVCVDGKNHRPHSGGKYRWVNDLPVFCGDFILGKQVKSVYNKFNHRLQAYEVLVVEFGRPRFAVSVKEANNDMIDAIIKSIENLADLTNKYFSNYLNNVIAVVQSTAPGAPINITPANAPLEALKADFDAEIEKIKKELDEKKWH